MRSAHRPNVVFIISDDHRHSAIGSIAAHVTRKGDIRWDIGVVKMPQGPFDVFHAAVEFLPVGRQAIPPGVPRAGGVVPGGPFVGGPVLPAAPCPGGATNLFGLSPCATPAAPTFEQGLD